MTLAKTCHASNMMQDMVEATHISITKAVWIAMFQLLNWKTIESHFETWSSDAQRINLTFIAYIFVANFVRYISAKYYLNWFSFHTVIMKVLGVNFFLKHSVYIYICFAFNYRSASYRLTTPNLIQSNSEDFIKSCFDFVDTDIMTGP